MGIQIPAQYEDGLESIEVADKRTDDEILRSLLDYRPVTSEKNIWGFWDSGLPGMSQWLQRNVIDWVRICGPEWTVRILDSNPDSPNYAAKYVPTGLPDAFYHQTMDGMHVGPHSADFLRGACIYEYGGAWMDVSIILLRHLDRICWNQLEDPASPYRVAIPFLCDGILNCFVAGRKHDPFIKRWHDLFMHVWQGRNNATGVSQHPLLAAVMPYFEEDVRANPTLHRLNIPIESLADYGAQILCWKRVAMLDDAGDGFSGSDYCRQHVKWIDCEPELLYAWSQDSSMALHSGQKVFDQLAMKRDGPTDSEQYKKAQELVWTQLTKTSMLKIGTIKGLVDWVSIGTLWNMPENRGKDNEPGTFGELLRYVPSHFKQTRDDIVTVQLGKATVTIKKGVLEP